MNRDRLPFIKIPTPPAESEVFDTYIRADVFIAVARTMMYFLVDTTEQPISKVSTNKKPGKAGAKSNTSTKIEDLKKGMMATATLGAFFVNDKEPTLEVNKKINETLEAIHRIVLAERWETPDDPLLSTIYHLLKRKVITRAEASDFAKLEMDPNKVGTQDSFRKRIDYWAKIHGLDPIGQTRRPPRK
jgi:hypothetical protein